MPETLETWFKREVLIYEDVLMRFLGRSWPFRNEQPDLRQEIYARVYEAAMQVKPQAPKAFLFSVARHVMTDRRRRERIVSIQAAGDNDFSNDLVDEKSPEHWVGTQ